MNQHQLSIEQAASILKLLADKTRLTIVKLLEHQDCCVCEFVEVFQVSQPSISQHLRKLRDAGIVKEERRGQWIFYSMNTDNRVFPFIKHVLSQLPNQEEKLIALEKSGKRISCC
ncbi:HTH-type transcriptional repressor AseR [Paraliobacillus sp. PM-2]|uniref:ArsR/SmtB family transcription factor n=1 Tax=Paraliobacillus sp. PM-2 TaxID=1462524 RepID=UPI00061C73AF|nr:metalloregulator ArsR/SmtB family transcription factor [Paraliobacillus sp. PM-2]CQR46347.1 HTH-type transcriptional repressor AseR [Paraliobacillus sp. PM-2]